MRRFLCVFLVFLAIGADLLRADGTEPLLKAGELYVVASNKDAPAPFHPCGAGSCVQIKVIKYSLGQWYWVEYDIFQYPAEGKPNPVLVLKSRMWLNLAEVTEISAGLDPDYNLWFPKGYQIVPYQAKDPSGL